MKHCLRGAAFAVPAALAVLSLACSSAPSSSGDGGTTADTGATEGGSTVTFSDVYTTIIAVDCTNSMCHFPNPGPNDGDLDLSSQATAYAQLVNVPATTAPIDSNNCTGDRVVPGSPSTSLLYLKVAEALPPCGARMPDLQPPLTSQQIGLIQTWITEGAHE
jgi:hypothetical protein